MCTHRYKWWIACEFHLKSPLRVKLNHKIKEQWKNSQNSFSVPLKQRDSQSRNAENVSASKAHSVIVTFLSWQRFQNHKTCLLVAMSSKSLGHFFLIQVCLRKHGIFPIDQLPNLIPFKYVEILGHFDGKFGELLSQCTWRVSC